MSIAARIKILMGEMKIPEFARLIDEEKPQRLKDVLGERQRVPEDMLVKILKTTGADANWLVLGVGERPQLAPREQALLDNYRVLDEERRRTVESVANLAAQSKAANSRCK